MIERIGRATLYLGDCRDILPTLPRVDLVCMDPVPESETILDPYMGTASTGVAAIRLGKSFVGIERDPAYFEVACRRIREVTGDDAGPLFGEAA